MNEIEKVEIIAIKLISHKIITKNGEMGLINWIQVINHGEVIAEIRESNCNLYGKEEL
jgi:hypothetical protein